MCMPMPPLWPVNRVVARGLGKGTAPGKLSVINCSGGSQSPESSKHAKVRAFAVDRGFRSPKRKKQEELQKCYPGGREEKQMGIPPAGKQTWRACLSPVQVGTQLLPAASSNNCAPEQTLSHNPGLWRSRPAYLALPHILEKDAEVMFSHALRDGQGHQFILHSYWAACQAGQQKARKRFGPWFGCSRANPHG